MPGYCTSFGADILSAVHDSSNLDTVQRWDVENQILADRKATQLCAQFAAIATGKRRLCQHIERSFDADEQRVGRSQIVCGDVVPDRRKVDFCLRTLKRSFWHF